MKIGVIADIHSNIMAFRACQEYLESVGCEEFVYLGDYVSDTPYTKETMAYLYDIKRNRKSYFIRGNREEYMLEQKEAIQKNDKEKLWGKNSGSGNLLYTLERLSDEDLHFFQELPISFVYEQEGYPAIRFCHGSPNNSRELLQHGKENTKAWLEKIDEDYLICAHTHRPGITYEKGKCYANTGSCGIAIADCGYAQCLVLESVKKKGFDNACEICWAPQLIRVPYDQNKVVEDMFETGLYDYAPWYINANIHIFLTGIDKCAELVALSGEKMAADPGNQDKEVKWPNIDEKYFAQAAKELQIPNYGMIR